eukprot:11885074-Ditylum_brightwellii.AAC.1
MRYVADYSEDLLFNLDSGHTSTEDNVWTNADHDMCYEINFNNNKLVNPDIGGDSVEYHFEELSEGGEEVDWSEGYDK